MLGFDDNEYSNAAIFIIGIPHRAATNLQGCAEGKPYSSEL